MENHDSAKNRYLSVLVERSYDLYAEALDDDATFLEKAIKQEKNKELWEAFGDLYDFLFP